MGETPRAKRRLKWWHFVAVVLAVCILALVVYRIRCHTKLEQRLDALRAAGYPVTLAELDEWYEQVPYGENAAQHVLDAIAYLQELEPEQKGRIPWLGDAQKLARTGPLGEETSSIIAKLLQNNEDAIERLQTAGALEHSRYPVELTKGHAPLPHLGSLLRAVQLLCLKAIHHAEQGEQGSAAQAIVSVFGIANSLAAEPLLMSQMVRQMSQSRALSVLERVMSRTNLNEDHLVRLRETITAAYDPNATVRGLVGERCIAIQTVRDPDSVGIDLTPILASDDPSLLRFHAAQALGVVDRLLIRYIDHTNRCVAALRLSPSQHPQAARELEREYQEIREAHSVFSFFTPSAARCVWDDLANMTRLRLAGVALEVERYRLANDRLPEQLADLVPGFLEAIPLDPYDGQPLRYERLDPGFVVYSIAKDGVDEGGRERPARQRGREEPSYDITFIVER